MAKPEGPRAVSAWEALVLLWALYTARSVRSSPAGCRASRSVGAFGPSRVQSCVDALSTPGACAGLLSDTERRLARPGAGLPKSTPPEGHRSTSAGGRSRIRPDIASVALSALYAPRYCVAGEGARIITPNCQSGAPPGATLRQRGTFRARPQLGPTSECGAPGTKEQHWIESRADHPALGVSAQLGAHGAPK